MESGLVATLMAPLIILLLINLWKKRNHRVDVDLPPGPKKLPIIGNLHLISDPPFRSFRDLAKQYGPIMHLKLGELDTIVVSSPEIAKQVFKDNDPVFANRPESVALEVCWYNYIDVAFCPYGEYWREMRKLWILEVLSAKSVRSFAPIRKDEISRLVKHLHVAAARGNPVNLTEMVGALISSITCRSAFGTVCKDKASMIKIVHETLGISVGFSIVDIYPSSPIVAALRWVLKLRLLRMRRKIDFVLEDIIRRHENSPTSNNGEFGNEDLVDVLLRIKETGQMKFPIGYDNIKAMLLDMFAAGTDTSSSTIVWAMTELMRNPRVLAKAQAEVRQVITSHGIIEDELIPNLKYIKCIIMETLRLHPQGSVIIRLSKSESREIGGYTIPKNVRVAVNIWAIHRDPNYWPDPETFKPERFEDQQTFDFTGNNDFRYIPFGGGKRTCPGVAYGTTSVTLILAQLLYSFNWKLPDGVDAQTLNMIENTGVTTSRKQDLIVVPIPFEPATSP
uniref:Cytochrome P450 n=1 Tax=Perilla frutescens TaxID=48386 RepID=A0A7R7EXF9_PERFR|nr:cytochrome P450 [Perilla frutescens]